MTGLVVGGAMLVVCRKGSDQAADDAEDQMMCPSLNLVDPAQDMARFDPEVHYRLYDSERHGPVVVCVQDFDYVDYDGTRFLSYEKYRTESAAEQALRGLGVLLAQLVSRFQGQGLLPTTDA